MKTVRISQGVGSNPKLWAVGGNRQIGEFDLSDEPGSYDADADGINGMSGIVWRPDGSVKPRELYASVEAWVADIQREYPNAVIIRDDNEPQNWL